MEDHPVQLRKHYLIGELHAVTDIQQFNGDIISTDIFSNKINDNEVQTVHVCKIHQLKRDTCTTHIKGKKKLAKIPALMSLMGNKGK